MQQLLNRLNELGNTAEGQRATLDAQAAALTSLQERLVTLENSQPVLPTETPSTEPTATKNGDGDAEDEGGASLKDHTEPPRIASRSEKLPDPEPFKGRRKALPAFLSKLQYKLEGNADRYPTERSKFLYAVSRIEGEAADTIRPLLDKDISSLEQLLGFLQATYGDPNRKSTAQARLERLEQGNKGFLNHFAEFRRYAADSELNEAGLIMELRRSLNKDLKRAMVGLRIPDKLNEYANQIVQYDNDLRFINFRPMTYGKKKDYDAMDLDQANLGYAPKDSVERERRKKLGLCFKCGSREHISSRCSVPMPTRTVRAAEARSVSRGRSRNSSKSSEGKAWSRS